MPIEYQTLFPHPCGPGDVVSIEGHEKWVCIIPCTVIGNLVENGIPVIGSTDGPKIIDGELVPQGYLRTPGRSEQASLEVMILGEYKRLNVEDMKGRRFIHCRFHSELLLLIDEEKNYVKLVPYKSRYDDPYRFDSESLTMDDLQDLGLLSDEDWERHKDQQKAKHADSVKRLGRASLKKALQILGPTAVKKIIGVKGA